MNVLELLTEKKDLDLNRVAFAALGKLDRAATFGDLLGLAAGAQKTLREDAGLKPGDTVLVAALIGPALYASVMALLGLGVTVILVEPFLPVHEIDRLISRVKPKAFLASRMGMIWGFRTASIRKIPRWIRPESFRPAPAARFEVLSVDPSHPGTVAFSSGTTGGAKGVVRTHGGLQNQNRIITRAVNLDRYAGPDLTIFANLVLANLAIGRGSVFVPPPRGKRMWGAELLRLNDLPAALKPETLTSGPGFLKSLLAQSGVEIPTLRSVHIGGALTDCWIFEEGFRRFPDAGWTHVYGSSEAEPVALSDARVAVEKSRAQGYFQTLYVGDVIPDIRTSVEADGLWVAGPHVGPFYLENEAENLGNKRRDAEGTIWHFMGDRVGLDRSGAWFQGRSGQTAEDFKLEQAIYSKLESSASFVHRDPRSGGAILVGENLARRAAEIRAAFPAVSKVEERKIVRDRRHRARIDRKKTLGR